MVKALEKGNASRSQGSKGQHESLVLESNPHVGPPQNWPQSSFTLGHCDLGRFFRPQRHLGTQGGAQVVQAPSGLLEACMASALDAWHSRVWLLWVTRFTEVNQLDLFYDPASFLKRIQTFLKTLLLPGAFCCWVCVCLWVFASFHPGAFR